MGMKTFGLDYWHNICNAPNYCELLENALQNCEEVILEDHFINDAEIEIITKALENSSSITSMVIKELKISTQSFQKLIQALLTLPKLEKVVLKDNMPEQLIHIEELNKHSNLKVLTLSIGEYSCFDKEYLAIARAFNDSTCKVEFEDVTNVNIMNCFLSREDINIFKDCLGITEICLNNIHWIHDKNSPNIIVELVDIMLTLPNLESVEICNSEIYDREAKYLAELAAKYEIRRLYLSSNNITAAGALYILHTFKNHPNREVLDLSNNNIIYTDKLIEAFLQSNLPPFIILSINDDAFKVRYSDNLSNIERIFSLIKVRKAMVLLNIEDELNIKKFITALQKNKHIENITLKCENIDVNILISELADYLINNFTLNYLSIFKRVYGTFQEYGRIISPQAMLDLCNALAINNSLRHLDINGFILGKEVFLEVQQSINSHGRDYNVPSSGGNFLPNNLESISLVNCRLDQGISSFIDLLTKNNTYLVKINLLHSRIFSLEEFKDLYKIVEGSSHITEVNVCGEIKLRMKQLNLNIKGKLSQNRQRKEKSEEDFVLFKNTYNKDASLEPSELSDLLKKLDLLIRGPFFTRGYLPRNVHDEAVKMKNNLISIYFLTLKGVCKDIYGANQIGSMLSHLPLEILTKIFEFASTNSITQPQAITQPVMYPRLPLFAPNFGISEEDRRNYEQMCGNQAHIISQQALLEALVEDSDQPSLGGKSEKYGRNAGYPPKRHYEDMSKEDSMSLKEEGKGEERVTKLRRIDDEQEFSPELPELVSDEEDDRTTSVSSSSRSTTSQQGKGFVARYMEKDKSEVVERRY